jgi:DNA-binding LacI/PurR family transcriptional regulator
MDRIYPYQSDNRWWAAYVMGGICGQMETLEVWRDSEPDFEGFQAWFRRVNPDAIICVYLPTVVGWLEKMGLKVPDDISVATIAGAKINGSYSGVVENGKICGKIAMDVLMDRINRGLFDRYDSMHKVKIAGQWNQGETVSYNRDAQ